MKDVHPEPSNGGINIIHTISKEPNTIYAQHLNFLGRKGAY